MMSSTTTIMAQLVYEPDAGEGAVHNITVIETPVLEGSPGRSEGTARQNPFK